MKQIPFGIAQVVMSFLYEFSGCIFVFRRREFVLLEMVLFLTIQPSHGPSLF